MIRIAFIGAGAVGGYFGGLMAVHYSNSKELEIYFICRDATADKIRSNGLILETTHGEYKINPHLFSNISHEKMIFDFIFCCTKSFDLLESISALKPNIGKETIIVPLLNGVDSYDAIKSIYPDIEVWDACVYIVSRVIEPGHIKETGGIQLLYFGSRDNYSPKLKKLEQLLIDAGIKATYSDKILTTMWEKFLFISSIATLTSYLNKSIGEILLSKEYKSMFQLLLDELRSIAIAKKIELRTDIFESIYIKMQSLPFEASSSMHRDFKNGSQTELETLAGSVIRMSDKFGISVPEYKKMYLALKTIFPVVTTI